MQLTEFQKRLCNAIQTGLEVCAQPFVRLAGRLGADEESVIENLNLLRQHRYIKHIRALLNYKSLGRCSTLVTAHIEPGKLDEVTGKINSLSNVSHNYLRQHYYNLWFTPQGESNEKLEAETKKLSEQFGAKFLSLPAVKTYKLDTRFDIAGNSEFMDSPLPLPSQEKVNLTEKQFAIIRKLQKPLPLVSQPFEKSEIAEIRSLYEKGIIRRIAGIVNYRRLGFTENTMLVMNIEPSEIDDFAAELVGFKQLSHCYHRRPAEGFDYNLFAMLHGTSRNELNSVISEITHRPAVNSFRLLPTVTELKKKPVRPG
jgi:DNA-binding Lrp family transcriptional regulator